MAKIHLTGGHIALVDEADAPRVFGIGWYASRAGSDRIYVQARVGRRRVYLHRWIMGEQTAAVVRHMNGNGLDNRRENLVVCARYQSAHASKRRVTGSAGLIGVQQFGSAGRYRAMLRMNNARLHLGIFDNPDEAARVRDYVARRLIGQFAVCNFATEDPPRELPPAAAEILRRHGA